MLSDVNTPPRAHSVAVLTRHAGVSSTDAIGARVGRNRCRREHCGRTERVVSDLGALSGGMGARSSRASG